MSFLLTPSLWKDKDWDLPKLSKEKDFLSVEDRRDWRFAYKMLFNARCIGTPMATPSVTHLTPSLAHNYKRRPNVQKTQTKKETAAKITRRRFITHRILILFGRYIATCIFYDPSIYHYTPNNIPWTPSDFSPSQEAFLRRIPSCLITSTSCITSREVVIRLWYILERILPDYLILSSCHDLLGILAVSTRLNEVEEWNTPLFGSIFQAFTVRRYWSFFWHHLIYRSFSAWAGFFTSSVLRVKRTRYANNALVFLLSGLMHALVEWHLGDGRCGNWAVASWFFRQIGAIVVEEVVQKIWAGLGIYRFRLRRMEVLVGYV